MGNMNWKKNIKKSLCVIGMLGIMFSFLTSKTSAAVLSYWYSDSTKIGKWTYSPQVFYHYLDFSNSLPMPSGFSNAAQQWNAALGLSITTSNTNTSAPIRFFGGTKEHIDNSGIFSDPVPTNYFGNTYMTNISFNQTHYYNNSPRDEFVHYLIKGYIVEKPGRTTAGYYHTMAHELGHALGWRGHISGSTYVMASENESYAVQYNEKIHLAQVYQ